MVALDRTVLFGVLVANLMAGGVLYQRLDRLGYVEPLKQHLRHVMESAGLLDPDFPQCGLLQGDGAYVLTSSRVVRPDGVRPGAVTVRHGRIAAVDDAVPRRNALPVLDFGYAAISPGVIDVHAHLNEPGREHWEGMETGTAAAAAGGVTTVVDMPLNSHPCTVNASLLADKMAIAEAKAKVNVGFWGGIVPDNARRHDVLWAMLKQGALGFKSFAAPSGIGDFANVSRSDVAAALGFLAAKGAPFFVHAELVSDVEGLDPAADPRKYATYLATRPASFERDAAHMLIDALQEERTRHPAPLNRGFALHIAHLGDAENVEAFRAVKRRLPLSVETCPHYLLFSAENVPDGATQFKCAPPLRDDANRRALVQAVADGDIDVVSSDHSPAPGDLKERESGDFLKAWGGISGLQYLLPATWTAVKDAGVDLLRLSRLLSSNPAILAGLRHKGAIAKGMDADLVVWDPDAAADTGAAANRHRHKLSPYTDAPLKGRVLATFVGGHKVFDAAGGGVVFDGACGRVVRRKWLDNRRTTQPEKQEEL